MTIGLNTRISIKYNVLLRKNPIIMGSMPKKLGGCQLELFRQFGPMKGNENIALIVVDMDTPRIFGKPPRDMMPVMGNLSGGITRLASVIEKAGEHDIPTIFIKNEKSMSTNNKRTDIVRPLAKATDKDPIIFEKSGPSAFRSGFAQYVEQNKLGTLIITGTHMACCVLATVIDALEKGHNVVVSPSLLFVHKKITQEYFMNNETYYIETSSRRRPNSEGNLLYLPSVRDVKDFIDFFSTKIKEQYSQK